MLSPTYLHILDGFNIHYSDKDGSVLTWTEVVSRQQSVRRTGGGKSAAGDANGTQVPWAMGGDEQRALSSVWFQHLHSDFGYNKIPLRRVRLFGTFLNDFK